MLARVRPGLLLQTAVRGGALAGALGAASCGPGLMPPSLRHPLAGSQAPSMQELGAQPTEVGIWHGPPVKVTVVDFWASWCQGCQESLPALDALYRDKRGDGLSVIGVSVDERRDDAYAMAQALHASFPIVVDQDARLASSYGVAQVPLTFVVDRSGTVRWVGRDPGAIRRAVEVVLAE
jgi:cytochrome c biogenesis protein CcmG, thiol:disulfide interchange protein DsbE